MAMAGRQRKRDRSVCRPVKYKVLDSELVKWIRQQLSEYAIVSPTDLGLKAEELLPAGDRSASSLD